MVPALRVRSLLPVPIRPWTNRHTLALLSLMSSAPRLPAPESTGSPTSICHWPKAPRAFFTRHFLTGERTSEGLKLFPAKSDKTLDNGSRTRLGSAGHAGALVLMLGLVHLIWESHDLGNQTRAFQQQLAKSTSKVGRHLELGCSPGDHGVWYPAEGRAPTKAISGNLGLQMEFSRGLLLFLETQSS